jgi:hypothetical protein
MNLKDQLYDYLISVEVWLPNSPGHRYSIKNHIPNLAECIEILYALASKETDTSLDRLQVDFPHVMENIITYKNLENLPKYVEDLAQLFEPYIKKIGYLKYATGDKRYFYGDQHTLGINGTSLDALLKGELTNTKKGDENNIPQLTLPTNIFDVDSGLNRKFADYVRTNLRNAVHYCKSRPRNEYILYSEIVIFLYLLVIRDNFKFLAKYFLPHYSYLINIIESEDYKNLDSVYVELFGNTFSDIDVLGVRFSDVNKMLSDIESFSIVDKNDKFDIDDESDDEIDIIDDLSNSIDYSPQSIIELLNGNESFYLIGDPGSGKSTSLLKCLYQTASKVLAGEELKIPLYLIASEFSRTNTFLKMIMRPFNHEWVAEKMNRQGLLILIDGLNEIATELREEANLNLREIIADYPRCTFIITERKVSFRRIFDIPTFELKPLEENQIRDFVKKYGQNNGDKIWTQLVENKQLMQLAHNPLMLKMILSTSKKGDVPSNKGKLFHLFIRTILEREERKRHQTDIDLKLKVLSKIAFSLRKEGRVSCNRFLFKESIKNLLLEENHPANIDSLFKELVDNFIIKISEHDDVLFIHESYLEYFVGYSLMTSFKSKGTFERISLDDYWIEPFQICFGLIDNETEVTSILENLVSYDTSGQERSNKTISSFGSSDLNDKIYILAKVITTFNDSYPTAFSRLESIINNYLIVWKAFLYRTQTELIEIESLFKSITYLNSERIYKIILSHPGWVQVWLCSNLEIYENEQVPQLVISDIDKDRLFRKIALSIAQNIQDISIIFKQIDHTLIEYRYFRSVTTRVSELKKLIIENTSYKSLKNYFLNNKQVDIEIICRLIQQNIDDITLYKFDDHTLSDNFKVLKSLLASHHSQIEARNIALHELKQRRYTDKLQRKLIEFLYSRGHNLEVISIVDHILSYSSELDDYMIEIVQQLNWESLTDRLQKYFNPTAEKLAFKILDKDSTYIRLLCENINDRNSRLLFSKGKYFYNNKCQISSIDPLEIFYDFIIKSTGNFPVDYEPTVETNIDINTSNEKLNFKIKKVRTSGSNNLVVTVTDRSLSFRENYKKLKGSEVNYKNQYLGKVLAIQPTFSRSIIRVEGDIESLTISNDYVFFDMSLEQVLSDMDTTEIGSMVIHPTLLKKSQQVFSIIIEKFKSDKWSLINFLLSKKLIDYYLERSSIDFECGIVTSNNKEYDTCTIYFSQSKSTKEFKSHNNLNIGNIVLVDERSKIHPLKISSFLKQMAGFKIGKIIKYDSLRNEGFIAASDDMSLGDFFFSKRSCDFVPELGDQIEFVPVPNPVARYKGKFIALNITKV